VRLTVACATARADSKTTQLIETSPRPLLGSAAVTIGVLSVESESVSLLDGDTDQMTSPAAVDDSLADVMYPGGCSPEKYHISLGP
jgi:hypothetical protein